MLEILKQVLGNLRANKLRSFLTMFGILWGVIAVVILSATGDGFQAGNQHLLEELGRNVAIVWGGETSSQAGGQRAGREIFLTIDDARALARESPMIAVVNGEKDLAAGALAPRLRRCLAAPDDGDETSSQAGGQRAGREIFLTIDDARALARESPMIAVVSPELERNGVRVRSAFNTTTAPLHGIEPQYQAIRTIDIQFGRGLRFADEEQALRVAVIGADLAKKLFAGRDVLGTRIYLDGLPYDVIGQIRKKDQEDSYSGPDNDKVFIPFSAASRDFPRKDARPGVVSQIILSPHPWVVAGLNDVFENRTGRVEDIVWPLENEVRRVLARRHDFEADDPSAIWMWDTTISSLMFERMVQKMKSFFTAVGFVTLALGGVGVMNIMLVAVRERTREIGVRRAIGATRAQVQRQFFLEGFLLTMLSGTLGFAVAVAICTAVNTLPMPTNRFQGMIVTWTTGLLAVGALVVVGLVTSTLPARRAAQLPPVEALRYEI